MYILIGMSLLLILSIFNIYTLVVHQKKLGYLDEKIETKDAETSRILRIVAEDIADLDAEHKKKLEDYENRMLMYVDTHHKKYKTEKKKEK